MLQIHFIQGKTIKYLKLLKNINSKINNILR